MADDDDWETRKEDTSLQVHIIGIYNKLNDV